MLGLLIMPVARSLGVGRHRRIVILMGAGMSVASGLRPYRAPGGLWEEAGLEALAAADMLARAPEHVWALFGPLREQALRAAPNLAHLALAGLDGRPGDRMVTVLTQNVD